MIQQTMLNFGEIKTHGRDDEITRLQQAFNKVKQNEGKQTIFVRGDSGCGKTSLVQHFRNQNDDAIFVQGKFDAVSNQPMSAITEALSDLCNQVMASDHRQIIMDSLRDSLGCNFEILQKALPNIMCNLGHDIPTKDILHDKCEVSSMDRLYRSFRDFIEVCLEGGQVIVIFIDDLHWADDQSWDVLLQLIRDLKLTRLLLIGAYRTDELGYKREAKIQALSQENIASVLSLEDWDFEKVNSLLASLLHMRTSQTESLASLVFAKSAGNPYFTIEVLKAVKKHNFLRYSLIKSCWEWDALRIESSINIGDNLVEVILSKFYDLPYPSQKVLILCSCFGPKFDAKVVECILAQYSLENDTHDLDHDSLQLKSHIQNAAIKGILDGHRGSSVYRFAHDKIYEAIYSQVSKIGNAHKIHLRIGRLLLHHENERPEDNSLTFLAAKQSHYCLPFIETSLEAEQWAKLNLKATKAAIHLSAFRPAAEYLQYALLFNQDLSWLQYDLQLEILILQARVQLCLGDFPKCYAAVNEVIENATSIDEKIPIFEVHIDALGSEGRVEECLRLGLTYAKMLGVKLPQKFNKLAVLFAFYKAKQLMTEKTIETLSNYPMTTNPSMIVAIRILSSMVILSFQARLVNMMATLALINTTLILRHGFTDETGSILSIYGCMLARTGDFANGYAIGNLSLKISEKSKSGIPRTIMNYFAGLDHLRNPLHRSLEPLLRGYRIGFEVGDTVSGFYCCFLYIAIAYFVGSPLCNLLKDMESFSKEIATYNSTVAKDNFRMYYQSVINLTSNVINPTSLDGDAMTEESLSRSQVQLCKESIWNGKLMLGIYFNDYEVIKDSLDSLVSAKQPGDVHGSSYYLNMFLWVEGLGFIILARKTKQRRYRNLALDRIRKIETWVKKGNVNCYHCLLHLRAEIAIYNKAPVEHVKALFDSAISASRRAGLLNFVAVINERASYCFVEKNDLEYASNYMIDAFEAYQRWGAVRKCVSLIQEQSDLLPSSLLSLDFESLLDQTKEGTFLKGRERLSVSHSTLHLDESPDSFTNWGNRNLLLCQDPLD